MAILTNGLITFALLLTTIILETGNFSGHVLPVHKEEHFVFREKRNAPADLVEYEVEVELNVTGSETVRYLRSLLDSGNFTLALGPTVNVTHIDITTVCYPNGNNFQCRCEDQYAWPYEHCITYGACDSILGGTCRCINSIPTNGHYCQPQTVLPVLYEYQISIEVNTTDADTLINLLNNIPFPVQISNQFNISEVNITTVCNQVDAGIQCQCRDDYLWPCDKCATYGKCDGNTTGTCGCIKAFPNDGQYCQSVHHHNFTACPPSTAPPLLYEYVITIELNISDVTLIRSLLFILREIIYPFKINNEVQIYGVNISTVCSPSSGGYQCRCEDQYRWPCDQCVMYGTCDNITEDTCGCIKAVPPDGRYCRPADQHNFTACSTTTTTSPTSSTTITTTTVNTTTPTISTTPPVVYEYVISIELNTTDDTVKDLLSDISYPFSITEGIQVSDLNISTVCSPSSGSYQCRCEDQYRWPCDQCVMYGTCDNITEDTCGCIKAVPPDGRYCRPADQHNFTACSTTTTTSPTSSTTITTTTVNTTTPTISTTPPVVYEYVISIELNTTDDTVKDLLSDISYPFSITEGIQVSDLNISTVCSPSSGSYQCRCEDQYRWPCDQCVMYGTCDNITEDTCGCIKAVPPDGRYCRPADQHNFTACSTTTTTSPTSSTTITTTTVNTTTPTISTNMNTTAVTTPPTTIVTNTTTAVTTTSIMMTTTSSVTDQNSSTSVSVTSPAPNTNSTTATTTTITIPTTTVSTEFNVIMSIELNKTFTEELNDASSAPYTELKSEIERVLVDKYRNITGFLSVSVIRFRNGSVITDFVVNTRQIIPDEVAIANKNLTEAIESIAPVIGSVTALYKSPDPISFPSVTYTGQTMKLMCQISDNLNVGEISGSVWKFKGRKIENTERTKVSSSGGTTNLTINNVILRDIGLYECDLTGGIITFSQNGNVTNIRPAPVIRLQSQVNVQCQGTGGQTQSLECCVQSNYNIKWFRGSDQLTSTVNSLNEETCIEHDYFLESCSESEPIDFICKVDNLPYEERTRMNIFSGAIACNDEDSFGAGQEGDISRIRCDEGQEGYKEARCVSANWLFVVDTCIVTEIKELLIGSKDLVPNEVPTFVDELRLAVENEQTEIVDSSATISAIVDIIGNVAGIIGDEVSESVIEDVLQTVDVIIGDDSRESWAFLNANETSNSSSSLLGALETLASGLNGEVVVETPRILLKRNTFNNNFTANLNSSVTIELPYTNQVNVFITTITFPTLNNVMPVRNSSFDTSLLNETVINGAVVLVQINDTARNVTLSYSKLNKSLSEVPQCVFWNFALFDNLGAWDKEGCTFFSDKNNMVTCNCSHLTSFSILMSTNIPPELSVALDVITYVGVAISLASLVICLIIEGYVWKAITKNSTAFMRHVCIINTALSLLIADICFIIGAFIAKNPLENPGEEHNVPVGPCSTATFFMHFFYLALFFWMLVSGLLLFYRTVMVFSHMSKSAMLGIGFLLGYGCPLIIAVITVAVTAPGNEYIRRDNACWLNWFESHALLALVIPALTIVSINLVIVVVVLFKMLRRGVGDAAQTDERHTLVVILRCVVILTPLFGLTWALGIGTMISSTNKGLHIAFAFFNSLQGFFILVFGTLFDSKIRSILSRKLPTSSTGSNNTTRSTSGGISSPSDSVLNWIHRLRGRRYIYHVSEMANSSSTSASESFINI